MLSFSNWNWSVSLRKSVGDNNVSREIGKVHIMEEVKGHKEMEEIQPPQKNEPIPLHG